MRLRMRWAILAVALVVALIGSLQGCARGDEPSLPPLRAEGIGPESLWSRIGSESPYARYASWPGHDGVRMGQAPHGSLHRIFINKTIIEALPIAANEVPEGGIIVMENLDSDSRLTEISVMAKVKGFDAKNGDWYWASFDPKGKVSASGSVRACIGCHSGMRDNDFVIVRKLDSPLK